MACEIAMSLPKAYNHGIFLRLTQRTVEWIHSEFDIEAYIMTVTISDLMVALQRCKTATLLTKAYNHRLFLTSP